MSIHSVVLHEQQMQNQMLTQQNVIQSHQRIPSPEEVLLLQQNQALIQKNQVRANNEINYQNAWMEQTETIKLLNGTIIKLQQQISSLQKELADLNKQQQTNPARNSEVCIGYTTDEEELAKETEWIRVKSRKNKKRKMDTSLTPPHNTPEKTPEMEAKTKKAKMPPPIIVDGIKDFKRLHEMLENGLFSFQIKIINNENIKINVTDSDSYRLVASLLNEKNYSWFTYENKQDRPIKVIAKKLHHSCETQKIKEHLRKRGYKILDVTPKLKYGTKLPLNMFMLSFRQDENINKIFEITDILGVRVEVVPIKRNKLVPQCKNCQNYGHTQRYCSKEARCVRCTGNHHTSKCNKPKDAKPKCVHCGEAHPANYRGCLVAKEMQKVKNKQFKKSTLAKPAQRNSQMPTKPEQETQQNKYKLAVQKKMVNANNTNNSNEEQKRKNQPPPAENMLKQILDKLNKMNERISNLEHRAQGAIPKNKNG